MSWGANETTDGTFYLDERSEQVLKDNLRKSGRDEDVALDFDHNTVPGSKNFEKGKPKHIAAYGNPVLKSGDGLYLTDLEWTDEGKKFASNYKDLSPTVITDENGVVVGLHSAALTPNGSVYGLKFYSAEGFENMLKTMSSEVVKDYNKDGANDGLTESPSGEFKIKANDSDEGEMYLGADETYTDKEVEAHKDKVSELDADDHKSEYGDVEYADKENSKYPINNEERIRAAWSYINMPKNAEKYSSDKLSIIKGHIKAAAEKRGINIAEDDKKNETKPMSADNSLREEPRAYKGQPWYYKNNMSEVITKMSAEDAIKNMAEEIGLEKETDNAKVLFAFLAAYQGLKKESADLIVRKDNTNEGGLKQFSAEFNTLKNEIETLKKQKQQDEVRLQKFERDSILKKAISEGKNIPLSADERETVSIDILKSIVKNTLPTIPTARTMRTLSADVVTTMTPQEKEAKFKESFAKNI